MGWVTDVDPLAESVLTSLVTGVHGKAAGEAGTRMWDRMTGLVRTRFVRDDPTTRALEQVDLVSSDPHMVEAVSGVLAQRLADAARQDPALAAELSRWMTDASRVVSAEPPAEAEISGGA